MGAHSGSCSCGPAMCFWRQCLVFLGRNAWMSEPRAWVSLEHGLTGGTWLPWPLQPSPRRYDTWCQISLAVRATLWRWWRAESCRVPLPLGLAFGVEYCLKAALSLGGGGRGRGFREEAGLLFSRAPWGTLPLSSDWVESARDLTSGQFGFYGL